MRAVLLPLDGDVVAVAVDAVCEVLAGPHVTALPTAPDEVLGVCNRRGDLLPVFDTARLLTGTALGAATHAVVVCCFGSEAALLTTGMPAMAALAGPVRASERPGTAGTYLADRRPVTLIEPETLLAHRGFGVPRRPAEAAP